MMRAHGAHIGCCVGLEEIKKALYTIRIVILLFIVSGAQSPPLENFKPFLIDIITWLLNENSFCARAFFTF